MSVKAPFILMGVDRFAADSPKGGFTLFYSYGRLSLFLTFWPEAY